MQPPTLPASTQPKCCQSHKQPCCAGCTGTSFSPASTGFTETCIKYSLDKRLPGQFLNGGGEEGSYTLHGQQTIGCTWSPCCTHSMRSLALPISHAVWVQKATQRPCPPTSLHLHCMHHVEKANRLVPPPATTYTAQPSSPGSLLLPCSTSKGRGSPETSAATEAAATRGAAAGLHVNI